ncbi:formylglycine-generating enzyme family protein [Tenacibaculum sp. SG-28]|uniref:formylglycine-generating enzyme family protein n=1 Tax=Tenacibaculum sp. SG-28 TaxID=754426 RepID=UPI000CF3A9AA|nr:formylglycine-generating enzyme family protein [Tenacibaculum sp. SG-28]PQJ22771.1 hypothetical protein BSU00_00140 [Tenacibaculum sp. SG-28]
MQLGKNSLIILGVLFTLSCSRSSNKPPVVVSENKYCYLTSPDIPGKQYLSEKFLTTIANIQTNPTKKESLEGMVYLKGGNFAMGADTPAQHNTMQATALPQNDEFPKHQVMVSGFYMDTHEVTVGEFEEFVKATNYITVAEMDINWEELKKQLPEGTPKPLEEDLKAGSLIFNYIEETVAKNNQESWWTFQKGISWRNPNGLHPSLETIKNNPVTHVSWYDALAYAKWVGKRLPTEAEYEYAMRGGANNTMYPWGNEKLDTLQYRGNFFQGKFPYRNTSEDGYERVAPVMSFSANGYGLYDISGNVWEWTMDWYSAKYYTDLQNNTITNNPQGPDQTYEVYNTNAIHKVVRGGSFLCNDSWCSGYRNARRMRLSPDSGMEHLGFRLVRDIN